MNCKIRVTSAVAERIVSPTDSPTLFFYLILSSIILFMYESAIDERRIIFVLYEFITINVRRNKKMWEKNKDFKSITDVVQCDTSPNDWRRTGLPNF